MTVPIRTRCGSTCDWAADGKESVLSESLVKDQSDMEAGYTVPADKMIAV